MRKLPILLIITMMICNLSCKKWIEATEEIPSPEPTSKIWVTNFSHPGILHNRQDLDRIKSLVASGGYPPYGSYLSMRALATASATYQIRGPYANIARDGVDANTTAGFQSDFNAAYHNALQWIITGNEAHAKKSIEILNAYSNTLTGITGTNDNALTASLGGFILVNAAEIMRYSYPGWAAADVTKCETMFRNVFVKEMNLFYARPAYSNGNWGASVIKSMMGMGVFLNDKEIFNKAVNFYYSNGVDNGSLSNYIINETGQSQESGRDQGHVQLGLGCLAEACEVGYKQNLDMYGAMDNRLLKGYEYTAKYNLGNEVPYVQWKDVTGKYSSWPVISSQGRGGFSAVYEIAYNAYVVRKKMTMPYVEQVLNRTRSEGVVAGVDNPGFGSLLFYLGETQAGDPNLGRLNFQFNTDGNAEGWSTIQSGSAVSVSNGRLKVTMANIGNATTPKYRADLTASKITIDPKNFPIWAIHFNKPGNSNITLDTKLGSLTGGGTLLTSNDNINTYYWNLSTKFSDLTLLDAMTLKVADQTTGAPSYEVDWIMCFKSVDDLKAYLSTL